MVAGGQDLRDRHGPRTPAGRVYCGYSSSPSREAFLGAGGLLAHDAGQQPDAGVEQRQRGDLAAGQHVIADRDFLEAARRDHPLVDALEAAAQDDGAGAGGELGAPGACVSGAPRGLISRRGRGRRPGCSRWRGPARRPSSPCRARRRPACRRRCDACRWRGRGCRSRRATTGPAASALPARLMPSGPGNISGKIVSTVARHMRSFSRRVASRSRSGSTTTILLAGDIDLRHGRVGERQQQRLAACRRLISIRSPAPKLCSAVHGAERVAVSA